MDQDYFAHETAVIDSGCTIGKGTKIWHFTHVMKGCTIGENCNLGQNVVISPKVVLGQNVKIQNNVSIYTGVICEDDVFLGPSMVFTNIINPRSHVIRKDQYASTLVRKGATIGANATIVCGNEIGEYAFIGAGAVVIKDVMPYALVVGNPGRQAGWMSEYGHRLHFDENGIAICPESHEKYQLKENRVTKLGKQSMEKKLKPLNFALIGAAGYIAPRHMKAIKDTGNVLVAAMDPYDGVGIIDSYFPASDFFIEPERFDRHLDKLRRMALTNKSAQDKKVDFVSICSPNYMHDSHIRLALRNDAHAICEKPIVLNPWNLDALQVIEKETGKNVYTILQVRLHPVIKALREKILQGPAHKVYDVDLTYITSRGNWYYRSWKGDVSKSGGIATNIGIHFFDLLTWIFGKPKENQVHVLAADRAAGFLHLEKARIRWFLSLDESYISQDLRNAGKRTYRSLSVGGEEIEFSEGFTDLHTDSYRNIIDGNGFEMMEAKTCVEIVHQIRTAKPIGIKGEYHPRLKRD